MGPIIRKRSKRTMGPRLKDQRLRTLLGNKGLDTERSPLGRLKLMVTWSVSCNYRAMPQPATKESPDMLIFGRELRRKLPERIVPAGEIPIRQRDVAKKKQMKEYADKRRNAWESLIVVGDQVLLKQSKADVLTPAFDPRPFSVIGVKGSMITVKRGREIKSRNSSHCKLLKHAREDEYVAVDLDQGLDASRPEETETREDLRLQPDNLGVSSEMTIGGPRNEPDGPRHP